MQSNFVQYNSSYCSIQQYNARECTPMKDFEVGGLRVTRGNGRMSSGWGAWMVLPGESSLHRFLEILTFIATLLFNSNSTAAHRLVILIAKMYLCH